MAKSFRELKVWSKAIDLTELIYRLTAEFPKSEIYGLSAQMRRAAVSTASNIAEGSARTTARDFRHFVLIAKGSNCELQTQLVIAGRLGYVPEVKITEAEKLMNEVSQMLSGLATYLAKATPGKPTVQ